MTIAAPVPNSVEIAKYVGVPAHWPDHYDFVFSGVALDGLRVLDIGGGIGTGSIYAAAAGAREVLCLEPEADGSQSRMIERAKASAELAGVSDRITIDARYLNELTEEDGLFDVILIHNAINHFDEDATTNAHKSPESRKIYKDIFASLYDKLNKGGVLIIADCSRKNAFGSFGLKHPLARSIDFSIHQTPGTWADIAREAGFRSAQVRWTPVRYFGSLVTWATGNAFVSFFLKSHFVLHLHRAS